MSILCFFGIHKWKGIHRTPHNNWSGRICKKCGLAQNTFQRLLIFGGHEKEKMSLENFFRTAGGNKPMPWDKKLDQKIADETRKLNKLNN